MSAHTAGPYKRDERFVYASTMYRMPSGGEVEVNRFSASVSAGHECSQEEAIAVAQLFEAAPELLEALMEFVAEAEPDCGQPNCRECGGYTKARAAIAKATQP